MISASPMVWIVLVSLLILSAGFSGSETALYSLTPGERRRAGPTAERLLRKPRALLVTILLGNLLINLFFFAFAARLSEGGDAKLELICGLGALLAIVVFGEVLPKTLALRARVPVARLGAAPLSVLVTLSRPLQRAADHGLELFYRLLGEHGGKERGITTEDLAQALERSAQRGLLLDSEADILAGLVELDDVRVREIMTPRVDVLFLDRAERDPAPVIARALEAKAPWLVVIDGNPDKIVGRVRLRNLLRHAGELTPPVLAAMLEPVPFVPEVASALDLLHFLREKRVAQAVAVDEWGGTAGLVTIEDVFEEVVGDLLVEGEAAERAVVPLENGGFQVLGGLSIRDWNELFGHRVVPTEFETLGGFVTALLGRIPRVGDSVHSGGLEFRVLEVRRRRVVKLELRTEPAEVGA